MTVRVLKLTALIYRDDVMMFALTDIADSAVDICVSALISQKDIDCQSVVYEFVHTLSDL